MARFEAEVETYHAAKHAPAVLSHEPRGHRGLGTDASLWQGMGAGTAGTRGRHAAGPIGLRL